MELKTKLPSRVGDRLVGDYTAEVYSEGGLKIVKIVPCTGTAGSWRYRLETLLGIGEFDYGGCGDVLLLLDGGQDWSVSNVKALLREIINF